MHVFFCSTAQNIVYTEQARIEATCDIGVTLGQCFRENRSQCVTSRSQRP
ncbi:hypothetical protein K443DRAFT_97513 [Laccaria amethystina LaAM-08-1]|uniref:Uncharacterized protein n=1 Tax=Laccaria amethystina LaAM-08-1 TaxID=1095629 RepID=A0A0C9WT23_9AGAR|nr:hypothetical protein K443DRAFT_109038 [Laccaria amethystina LaAM-08-1]KIK02075.1 hypothetical protein K443DRAFT_97513 [Laccaria amethystina LaAM-08-1]